MAARTPGDGQPHFEPCWYAGTFVNTDRIVHIAGVMLPSLLRIPISITIRRVYVEFTIPIWWFGSSVVQYIKDSEIGTGVVIGVNKKN